MTDKQTQAQADQSNMEKDPEDWVTGDEPMTGAQKSYLKTLSEEAKEEFDENLSKADASKRIDELQARTGRGAHGKRDQGAEGGKGNADEKGNPTSQTEETAQASGYTGA
jgi:hypothetical protein